MDSVARYDAAEILRTNGYNAAVQFIRGYVVCHNKATEIADEIAHMGE